MILPKLLEVCPLAGKFVTDLLYRFKQGVIGKVAAYNEQINAQFGLKQYEYILKHNGFISMTDKP